MKKRDFYRKLCKGGCFYLVVPRDNLNILTYRFFGGNPELKNVNMFTLFKSFSWELKQEISYKKITGEKL